MKDFLNLFLFRVDMSHPSCIRLISRFTYLPETNSNGKTTSVYIFIWLHVFFLPRCISFSVCVILGHQALSLFRCPSHRQNPLTTVSLGVSVKPTIWRFMKQRYTKDIGKQFVGKQFKTDPVVRINKGIQ